MITLSSIEFRVSIQSGKSIDKEINRCSRNKENILLLDDIRFSFSHVKRFSMSAVSLVSENNTIQFPFS